MKRSHLSQSEERLLVASSNGHAFQQNSQASKYWRLKMMNLGDGLLFELENGKPRLVLAKYGAESKSSNKKGCCRIPPRKKTQKIISSKQGPPQPDKAEQERKSKDTPAVSSVEQNITHGPRVTNAKHSTEALRVQSGSNKNDSCIVTQQKESVVCLTQEQFQQILSTINSKSAANALHGPNTHTHTAEPAASSEENSHGTREAAKDFIPDGRHYEHRVSQVKTDREFLSDGQHSGLFSTFGERERDKDKLEARKAQWRRELDEQMALKRQQKASVKHMRAHDESCKARLKDVPETDGMSTRNAAEIESSKCRALAQTQRELPAAIRSAFIVGEAAPMENVFNTQREEQQRRWLQELDQQREEAKLRRQKDKEINSQVEDIERWAVHFDSLHQPSTVGPDRGVPDMSSCLSHHRSVSGARSTAWEGMSTFGGDSLGRASVDTTQGNQQRSSYLRTMTALLDPAQIEERERQRLKQLEHQRAIEAQVEERRRQKEKEEATRRAQEQEEERRVERERERLQQQYINDTERQRHRKEVKSRKTEELYQSIQRAQEEAIKDRQFERIRDLAKKGHDVSKLLHSLEGDSVSQAFRGPDLPGSSAILTSSKSQTQRMAPPSTTSPRKDTAVQTEISHQPENETVRDQYKQSPAAVIHTAPPNTLNGKKSHHGEVQASKKSKDHLSTAPKEVRADPYEPYARTGRNHKQEKRPEWNTQRPSKAFVPASERYPEALKRHRQESRRQRQIELMTLVERNTLSRTPQQELLPPACAVNNQKPQTQRHRKSPQPQSENQLQEPSAFSARMTSPIPAVKNRAHQPSQQASRQMKDMGRPPLLDYVPYVRTDEVYQMDPLAPLSRPSTNEVQQRGDAVVSSKRQATPLVQHDPDAPKSTERQQAILKGLSELRQGLLQRQRELETSLNPLLQTQQRNYVSPFKHV
ncbi:coiled-coil domain-containing protein 66 isoform X3 [Megalobrama amblycephala]|uniref:coiled-coil domain-containing protein 66 isoform X3 n=1 Tax=Megalobrama amblycephala TaxID=75352 RepID=UPI0020147790|nr:coiled-coil domain-containing protein 66 isoform X3 [Megalobrama amblycephala]